MESQDFFILMYIMLREGVMSFFRFYAFKGDWRFSPAVIVWTTFFYAMFEWGCYFYNGRNHNTVMLYMFPVVLSVIDAFMIKAHINKQIFIILSFGIFSLIWQSLAVIAEDLYGLADMPCLVLTAVSFFCMAASFYPIVLAVRKYRDIWRRSQAQRVFLLVNIILIVNLMMTIIMRDFSQPRDWGLFVQRLVNTAPLLLFTYLILYLLKEIEDNKRMYAKINLMRRLYNEEKRYFDFVIETWQSSRRLRHDLRHHALLIDGYLKNKQYDKLKTYTHKFLEYIKSFESITLCNHEIIDGVAGYWQMQAKAHNIRFECFIAIDKIYLEDLDLAIILGNALENAFAAADKSAKDRFISLKIAAKGGFLLIDVENSFDGRLVEKDGKYYSSKNDFKTAGTGIENMEIAVRKYDGYCRFKAKEDIFTLRIAVENSGNQK